MFPLAPTLFRDGNHWMVVGTAGTGEQVGLGPLGVSFIYVMVSNQVIYCANLCPYVEIHGIWYNAWCAMAIAQQLDKFVAINFETWT